MLLYCSLASACMLCGMLIGIAGQCAHLTVKNGELYNQKQRKGEIFKFTLRPESVAYIASGRHLHVPAYAKYPLQKMVLWPLFWVKPLQPATKRLCKQNIHHLKI